MPKSLCAKQQAANRRDRNHALEQIKKRKQDTRRKIQLGGLVIKSGMDKYPKEVILGALMDIHAKLSNEKPYKDTLSHKGSRTFY